MGWTGYYGSTAREAIAAEFSNSTIHYQIPGWVVATPKPRDNYPNPRPYIAHVLTERHQNTVFVKVVELSEGPAARLPRTVAQAYMRAGGSLDAFGEYGNPRLLKALELSK